MNRRISNTRTSPSPNPLAAIAPMEHESLQNVGDELMVATAYDHLGNVIEIVYNPYFRLKNYMPTDQKFVDFVLGQLKTVKEVNAKKMFGEYGVYSNGKIFAVICDNRLFIKPTSAGRAFIGDVVEAPPYEGAKPSFLIDEKIEDRQWLSELVSLTVKELPEPKLKKAKKK